MPEEFYLGKLKTGEQLMLDSRHLVTHAVCVGMTGSGKTGLCTSILEEGALQGIPSIIVDIKGDMSNLMLSFPEFDSPSFLPWVSENEAAQIGMTKEDYATSVAKKWREGMLEWGMDGSRIGRMREKTNFQILTPGSSIAPVNILSSLEAPPLDWDVFEETLREKVKGTVSALLGIIGFDPDPMEKNHILLSNITERAWRKKENLTLDRLINYTLSPPFTMLGVMDVDTFMPDEERKRLAYALNALIASPSFESWIKGFPLDIEKILYSGRPNLTIFYVAHLNDNEKMFFITLLLQQFSTWMHAQQGTGDLRCLFYIDEIFGLIPPHPQNPPSKTPLLLLLKQARAFGCCMMLSTQNPVDLDYKGLTNAGIWFCGKLQTANDKERLLEGLEGVSGFSRSYFDSAISGLEGRTFICHNVHKPPPQIFKTRWAMSYLAGPLTKMQIKNLAKRMPETRMEEAQRLSVAPTLQDQPTQLFIPSSLHEAVYKPALYFVYDVSFEDKKLSVYGRETKAWGVPLTDRIEWDSAFTVEKTIPSRQYDEFSDVPDFAKTRGFFKKVKEEYEARLQKSEAKSVFFNETTKLCSAMGESKEVFATRVASAFEELRREDFDKLQKKHGERISRLKEKMHKEKFEYEQDKEELSTRKKEEVLHDAESVAGFFFGRRSMRTLSSAARKRGMTRKAEQEVAESEQTLKRLEEEVSFLEKELEDEKRKIDERYKEALDIKEIVLAPRISMRDCSLLWLPEPKD